MFDEDVMPRFAILLKRIWPKDPEQKFGKMLIDTLKTFGHETGIDPSCGYNEELIMFLEKYSKREE